LNVSHFAIIFALIAFSISSIGYLYALTNERFREILQRIAYGFFIFATFLITHSAINSYMQGVQVLTSGLILLGALCWITLIGQILFQIRIIGTFVSPLATLLLLIQIFTAEPHGYHMGEEPRGLIVAHIYTSVIGEAFGILAFVVAILFLFQKRAMKKKQINRLLGLALSLDTLNRLLLITIWSGFIFLTIGLVLGAIYTQFFATSLESSVSKIVWALIVWFWYLATLLARNVFRLHEKKIAQMTFIGFALMALGFFGLN
jgi:ABC-type uncharacterized transport system permease subunit